MSNNANCWRECIRTRGIWSSRSFRVHQVGGLTEMTSLPSESSGSGDSSFGRIFLPVVFGGVNPGVLKHEAPVVRRDPTPGQHLFSLLVRVEAGFYLCFSGARSLHCASPSQACRGTMVACIINVLAESSCGKQKLPGSGGGQPVSKPQLCRGGTSGRAL